MMVMVVVVVVVRLLLSLHPSLWAYSPRDETPADGWVSRPVGDDDEMMMMPSSAVACFRFVESLIICLPGGVGCGNAGCVSQSKKGRVCVCCAINHFKQACVCVTHVIILAQVLKKKLATGTFLFFLMVRFVPFFVENN